MRRLAFLIAAGAMISYGYAKPLTTAEEIQRAISGNTISGTESGVAYAEYYEKDGFIRGRDKTGLYSGEWQIAGQQLCLRYFKDDVEAADSEDPKSVPGPWDCSKLDVEGANVTFLSDGERFPAKLRLGNPDKL